MKKRFSRKNYNQANIPTMCPACGFNISEGSDIIRLRPRSRTVYHTNCSGSMPGYRICMKKIISGKKYLYSDEILIELGKAEAQDGGT